MIERDHLAAGPNHVANLIDRNLQGVNSRSISRNLLARSSNRLRHLVEDVQTPALCLSQSFAHDLRRNSADLDVHLQGGNAIFSSGHFEVHIAIVIFRASDIGKDGVVVAFLH